MPALAERTKIKSEWGYSSTIEDLSGRIMDQGTHTAYSTKLPVDAYAYGFLSASTRVVVLPYLPQPSSKAKEFLKKLYDYKNLTRNWDHNDAFPPDKNNILKASFFIIQMDEFDLPLYFISPGPNGEILLEYKNEFNTAEIFFSDDGTEEMILYNKNEQVYADVVDTNLLTKHLQ